MKKLGVLLVFLILITVVSAQNQTDDKARACLKEKVEDCEGLTLEEKVFSLLSLSDDSSIQSDCKIELKEEKEGESYGNIKDSSLALLALNHIGEDTEDLEDWILDKKKYPSELEGYLEIDSNKETSCEISYNGQESTITISESKIISGNPGSCLSNYNNYWLKINQDCLSKNFTVSCDQDFISTLLYKKKNSNVWHISSQVESASSGGETEHRVNSYCFGLEECDYESNLWAVFALSKSRDVSNYLPYLIALEESNEQYFPSSFLYLLTNSEDYLQKILNLQRLEGNWEISSKYYETALGLLSLSESGAESNAKSWLEKVQDNNGCWGSIRDTGFLLWAGWPTDAVSLGGNGKDYCEDFGYYCTSLGKCIDSDGEKLDNFICSSGLICCDKPPEEESCSDLGGQICPYDKQCSGSTVSASGTEECCLADCDPISTECEDEGYSCRDSCFEDEEETYYDCSSGQVCCKLKPEDNSYWWVWILALLIILTILGIIFRNKLRMLIFKFRKGKGGGKKTKKPPTGPSFKNMSPQNTHQPQKFPQKSGGSKTDKELQGVLKKLKDMSK